MEAWENELIKRVASDQGWDLVKAYSQQMRCLPDEVAKGADILVNKLSACGLSATVHTPEIYLGIPIRAEISLGHSVINAKASALSPSVKDLRAPLFHLKAKPSQQGVHSGDPGSLFEQRFASEDDATNAVSGKIVLTEGLSNPARTQLLQAWGALAVIVINPGNRSHWGTNSLIWGSPVGELERLPNIASVAVSRTEGDHLLALEQAGEAVTLKVEALHGWFPQPVVTAEVSGEGPEADSFVLLHSHYDAWEYGVGDNATGNAVLLEVARLFSQNPKPFRRSVRFAWWPGHSTGRYAGSAWYADAFGRDLAENCVAHVNCDSPGCKDASSYASIRSMSEAGPLLQRTIQELFGQTCTITRPGRAGDYSFNNLGISGTLLTSSMVPKEERERRGWYAVGGCGGSPAWHSEYDTLEVAERSVLENDIRLYALVTARLANESRVPLDYEKALADIRQHLRDLAPGRIEADAASRIDKQLAEHIDQLGKLTGDNPTINATLRRISRAIVRLNYALGPAHVQDPAKSLAPVPLLSEINTHMSNKPQHKLMGLRAANAIEALLDQISQALGSIPADLD